MFYSSIRKECTIFELCVAKGVPLITCSYTHIISLEPRLSVPDFPKLQDKIQDRKPGFEAKILRQLVVSVSIQNQPVTQFYLGI